MIRLVCDADRFIRGLAQGRAAADANPIRDGEDWIEWLRRVADAAFWDPEGWDE